MRNPILYIPFLSLSFAVGAANVGEYEVAGDTLVSVMMMFLGNEEKVYFLDKNEAVPTKINNHPAYAAVWDIASRKAMAMDVASNPFCAAGGMLPNGSWVAYGGNHAVHDVNGTIQDWNEAATSPYGADDGRQSIRVIQPCTGDQTKFGPNCQWYDNAEVLHMQARRWYATAESLGDGSVVIMGGMTSGGYINRHWPPPKDEDPETRHKAAQNTFEIYPPPAGSKPELVKMIVEAGGLNSYPHMFLMPSGKVFMQANISTVLWDHTDNSEIKLPDMPNGVVRVYPASAAVAMLPLTPANHWTPTILFCGGISGVKDEWWGGYGGPGHNMWELPASKDCQRITPEPNDGSTPAYEQDDDLPVARSMGQFILLPDKTVLLLNGAEYGTAGYTTATPDIPKKADLPFYESLATKPVLTPALYLPNAPKGQRFTSAGFKPSNIPRMYHSTAQLLPDGSVLVAGSNPAEDYNEHQPYPTTLTAEVWYPPYFNSMRPVVSGIPQTLGYGGKYFNLTIAHGSYEGGAGSAASRTTVVLQRGGFSTHAMNMGQRLMQLNSTYTLASNGDILLHVAPPPPNPNLLTPGPAMLFVVTNGAPSQGKFVTVGTGNIEQQPVADVVKMPGDLAGRNASEVPAEGATESHGFFSTRWHLIAVAAGGGAAVILLIILLIFCRGRSEREAPPARPVVSKPMVIAPPTDMREYSRPGTGSSSAGIGVGTGNPFAKDGYQDIESANDSTTHLAGGSAIGSAYHDMPSPVASPSRPLRGRSAEYKYDPPRSPESHYSDTTAAGPIVPPGLGMPKAYRDHEYDRYNDDYMDVSLGPPVHSQHQHMRSEAYDTRNNAYARAYRE